MRTSLILRLAGVTALALCMGTALAQQRLLKVIIPYSAGGLTDNITRLLAQSISKTLGRTVVIENKPGAATLIAIKTVQSAPADGNVTVMVQNIGFAGLPYTNKSATYDPVKDFLPVATIADGPGYIYVHNSVSAKNLAEFVAYAKTVPAGLEAATSGPGGSSHTWTLLLAKRAGIKLLPVPYKGSAEMTTAMITGETKVMLSTATEPLNAQVKAGNLRILAVASDRISPLTPEVPLAYDTVPGIVIAGWFGLIAAPNTPEADVKALAHAVQIALAEPGVKEKYAGLFLEPRFMGPQEFTVAIKSVQEFYKGVVADLQLTPQ